LEKILLNNSLSIYDCMTTETVVISREEYELLKKKAEIDEELLQDIAMGIKDILAGKVEEV